MDRNLTKTELVGQASFDLGAPSHPPDLYHPRASAVPHAHIDQITETNLETYRNRGFLAVDGVFNATEVTTAIDAINDLIDHHPEHVLFEASAKTDWEQLSQIERRGAVRRLLYFCPHSPRLAELSSHRNIIDIVERLIGEPVKLTQDMALLKPAKIGREKPWHQDHAYFNFAPDIHIVGVWIALDNATLDNGCMHVLPGWHRKGPIVHFQKRDWQICDTEILDQSDAQCAAVPLQPGGALFLNSLLPHGTPPNLSPERRRALQFHYAPTHAQETDPSQHLAVFGSEGRNVSC